MTYDKNLTLAEERYALRAIIKKEPIRRAYAKKSKVL